MKLWGFAAGIAVGMAAGAAAVTGMYPSVSRKMKRDGRRLLRSIKDMF